MRVDASLGLVLSLPTAHAAAVPAFAHISALADTRIDKIGKVRAASLALSCARACERVRQSQLATARPRHCRDAAGPVTIPREGIAHCCKPFRHIFFVI